MTHRYDFVIHAHSAEQAEQRILATASEYWGTRPFAWSATAEPVMRGMDGLPVAGFGYDVDARTWETAGA